MKNYKNIFSINVLLMKKPSKFGLLNYKYYYFGENYFCKERKNIKLKAYFQISDSFFNIFSLLTALISYPRFPLVCENYEYLYL